MAPLSADITSADRPDAGAPVRARAVTEIMQFLLDADTVDVLLQRAVASLGLLEEVDWADLDGDGTPNGACVLAVGQGSSARTLTVQLRDPGNLDVRQMIDGLLNMVGTLHDRVLREASLRAQAHTDPLTGLWNRRGFEPFVDQALARAARSGEEVTLLLVDLDHFKQINDALGHAAGDEALRMVAGALRSVIRPTDAAARLGGDEMALLLSSCSAHGATVVAERLRDALAMAQHKAGLKKPVTLSIGIADTRTLSAQELTRRSVAQLMAAADEAMYVAKQSGRDQFACHPRSYTPAALDEDHTSPIVLSDGAASARNPTAA
ncbi:MAG: GGDEF domain-containing protein [Myxococcota bacterium]